MAGKRRTRAAILAGLQPPKPRQFEVTPENRRAEANRRFALAQTDLRRLAIAIDYARGAVAYLARRDPATAAIYARDLWEALFKAGDGAFRPQLQPSQRRAS